jgi:DUF1365 family protein
MELESSIYQGTVSHERVFPTRHKFDYSMYFFWLKLNEIEHAQSSIRYFSVNKKQWYQFLTTDYFKAEKPRSALALENAAKQKMSTLGAPALNGDIYFMGQIRALGIFFSPVNFYFHKNKQSNRFDWMLAEVSNTPWNERHYYLVNLLTQENSEKVFHVSPFNPMDMQYRWQIAQPGASFDLALSCIKEKRHFTASMSMKKLPLNSQQMRSLLFRMPSTTIRTLIGIYWQALKLFAKRTPIYGHPGPSTSTMKENNHVAK